MTTAKKEEYNQMANKRKYTGEHHAGKGCEDGARSEEFPWLHDGLHHVKRVVHATEPTDKDFGCNNRNTTKGSEIRVVCRRAEV